MSEMSIGQNLGSLGKLDTAKESLQKTLTGANGGQSPAQSGASFLETLKGSMSEVNEMQVLADKASQTFAAGGNVSLHEVMIAMEKADLSLRSLTAVRNKVVEAYQEIMRMPV